MQRWRSDRLNSIDGITLRQVALIVSRAPFINHGPGDGNAVLGDSDHFLLIARIDDTHSIPPFSKDSSVLRLFSWVDACNCKYKNKGATPQTRPSALSIITGIR